MENIVKDKIAFDIEQKLEKNYRFIATYLIEPKGEALIEIYRDEKLIKEFLFPAYKIWNIAAHAEYIIKGLEQESEIGLQIAGSDGLGGNSYIPTNKIPEA